MDKTNKPIQIFKPGAHTAMNGMALEFSEADLLASAQAYNPALHEAPIVIGHPKTDAPAFAWVAALDYVDGLQATPKQVDPVFAEMVRAGRFKKVSASFYLPDSPSNPVPGVYYLRHVGFLGAQAPAVKGLQQAEFAEAGVIEFADSEYDDVTNAGLWRNLRDWFIGQFGQDQADKVIPGGAVQLLEQTAQDELTEAAAESGTDPGSPIYQEHLNPGDTMSVAEKEQLAQLQAENARLKQQQADFAEQQKKQTAAANHVRHLTFAEELIKSGQLLPAQKNMIVGALDFMSAPGDVVEFSEDGTSKPLLPELQNFLKTLPKQIEFGEMADAAGDQSSGSVSFAAPEHMQVDQKQLRIYNKALAYQRQHNTDYMTALHAVTP